MGRLDITNILRDWEYDPERTVRILEGDDGRDLLQVRLPLGVEQYELTGRPDGRKPHGHETEIAYVEQRLKQHIVQNGSDVGFEISTQQAELLQAEGILFYYRYLILYQIRRYNHVVSDTEHNLHLCDLLERYCADEEARDSVLQFRPYILRMHGASSALAIEAGNRDGDPFDVLHNTIERIEALEVIDSPAFQFERIRSVNYLRAVERKIQSGAPDIEADGDDLGTAVSQSNLETELRRAVENEDYERAAEIRDRIRRMNDNV